MCFLNGVAFRGVCNWQYCVFFSQLQHLIELIRQKKTEEALEFAQTQLSERGEDSPECLEDMERALALLAFDKPEDSPFSDLLLISQRHKVIAVVFCLFYFCTILFNV